MTRDDLSAALAQPNVTAFLRVIREGESSQNDSAYTVMFGGDHFTSFANHPRKRNTRIMRGRPLTSTAAGAFQFIARTWDEMARAYGLVDFSPPNQDLAAVGLIARRGALDDVIAGRITDAIRKCGREWASLPGSSYGQPTQALAHALEVYAAYGGRIDDSSTTDSVVEAPAAVIQRGVKPMAPLIPIVLEGLAALIPALGKLGFGSNSEVAQRNVAAGAMVAEKLVEVTKAVNLQEAAEKIQSDPDALEAAKQVVADVVFQIAEAGGGGIEGARNQAKLTDGDWRKVVYSGPFILAITLLPLVYAVVLAALLRFEWLAEITSEVRTGVITSVTGLILGSIVGYFYGTSASSSRKDSTLGSIAEARR